MGSKRYKSTLCIIKFFSICGDNISIILMKFLKKESHLPHIICFLGGKGQNNITVVVTMA